MASAQTTCWTVIEEAAGGSSCQREEFARRYEGAVRAYLKARWRGTVLSDAVDDGVQDVFVECFRQAGPLGRADRSRPGGFRPFLYGIVRNVARRTESRARERGRRAATDVDLQRVTSDEATLSVLFDRAWAKAIMQQAAQHQWSLANKMGEEAVKRVELLRLRFQEGLPIREIASLWRLDATHLHREYARARKEFKSALFDVVSFHHPDASKAELEQTCVDLLATLR